jgi:hypothetical protein
MGTTYVVSENKSLGICCKPNGNREKKHDETKDYKRRETVENKKNKVKQGTQRIYKEGILTR